MTSPTSIYGTQGERPHVHISPPLLLPLTFVEKPLLFDASRRLTLVRRDHGRCCLCGLDCLALHAALSYIAAHIESHAWWPLKFSELQRAIGPVARAWPRPLWEGDHVHPTTLGGPDTPQNWRTLCIVCHRLETLRLRAWLADHKLFRITGVPKGEAWTPAGKKLR